MLAAPTRNSNCLAGATEPSGPHKQVACNHAVVHLQHGRRGLGLPSRNAARRASRAAEARRSDQAGALGGTVVITHSASAVIVRLGLTPGLAGMIEPSQTMSWS